MTSRTIISVVKTIQFRTEVLDEDGKVVHGWNDRYRSPHAAASNYARYRISQWEKQRRNEELRGAVLALDHEYMDRLEDRFYRMMVRRFREMLV